MITNHLYPQRVFYYFEQIAAIPHGSRNTKAVIILSILQRSISLSGIRTKVTML